MYELTQLTANRFANAVSYCCADIGDELDIRGLGADSINVECDLRHGPEDGLVVTVYLAGVSQAQDWTKKGDFHAERR